MEVKGKFSPPKKPKSQKKTAKKKNPNQPKLAEPINATKPTNLQRIKQKRILFRDRIIYFLQRAKKARGVIASTGLSVKSSIFLVIMY
jgi:hypothetical protein